MTTEVIKKLKEQVKEFAEMANDRGESLKSLRVELGHLQQTVAQTQCDKSALQKKVELYERVNSELADRVDKVEGLAKSLNTVNEDQAQRLERKTEQYYQLRKLLMKFIEEEFP